MKEVLKHPFVTGKQFKLKIKKTLAKQKATPETNSSSGDEQIASVPIAKAASMPSIPP